MNHNIKNDINISKEKPEIEYNLCMNVQNKTKNFHFLTKKKRSFKSEKKTLINEIRKKNKIKKGRVFIPKTSVS
jgi:hypothetical protein